MLLKSLPYYHEILSGKAKPNFFNAPLNQKIKEARKILEKCELCERGCGTNRAIGKLGFCQVPTKLLVCSAFDHWGEEPFLVPSFTIFLWSCTFSCVFCQNWTISQRRELPAEFTPKQLADLIQLHSHCKNVNFVGGEPTPYLPLILEVLKELKKQKVELPVVWNSNFYMSEKAMELLRGVVDIYLSDWKYGNDSCAEELSGIKSYLKIVERNHKLAAKDAELVIRHLVLPGHLKCCTKPVLEKVAELFNGNSKVVLNLMDQYRPEFRAHEFPKISKALSPKEFEQAKKFAEKLGINFIV